jgi:serine/threonine protein phosphatase PrpC
VLGSDRSLEYIAHALVERANAHGGTDNIAAALARIA